MSSFWENVWSGRQVKDYIKYINLDSNYKFIDIFKKNNISNICDAACGFGKYSAICIRYNFKVSGFDISKESVNLTRAMLEELNLKFIELCVCSITDIKYQDDYFDGVIAHAVIDHLVIKEAVKALNELYRITKKNGLIYITFDGLEEDDNEINHLVLDDGSYKYTEGARKGMIFKYYTNDEIFKLTKYRKIIFFNTKQNGEREVILRKE